MKCLSCKKNGTHYIKKICPQCTIDGVKPEHIKKLDRADWFDGATAQESGRKAGQFVEKLKEEKVVSNIKYSVAEAFGRWETTVTWKEYKE